jgi:hypothetical protein
VGPEASLDTLRAQSARAIAAGRALWHAGAERRAAWLGQAFAELSGPGGALFGAALELIPHSAGLSREMVHWALESALEPLSGAGLLALDRGLPVPHPGAQRVQAGQLCVVVLAGNVFTAAARAVALPLLLGLPVLAKASSHDAAFVQLLGRALLETDEELGQAFQLAVFSADAEHERRALLERADVVSAYGGDDTLQRLRAQLPATVSFVGHGHGLGAAFVDRGALADEASAHNAAGALAFDVAAYDQRGCLSPLVVWVREGAPVSPERFGELVFEALARLARTLPRGPLPLEAAAAQLNFRGVATLRGTLLEGDGFAVCCEGAGALRIAPGYRNLQLLNVADAAQLGARLAPLGVHLKCLGVAGVADLPALLAALPARLAPRVCALGRMQTPPLHALADGLPAWEGLVRFAEHDT